VKGADRLSWGRHPALPQQIEALHWRGQLPDSVLAATPAKLAFGNGRSYGDSCLSASGHLIGMRGLDRFLAFDVETGVVQAEAGMTLDQLSDVSLPAGWFVPVTPGTAHVTLGGAVANDVHGKNHHRRGTLGSHLTRIGLFRSDRGRLTCSRDDDPELFAATIGGLGLTGVIEWVELRLMPVSSPWIDTTTQRFDSLEDFFDLSETLDGRFEYAVSWVDVLATGRGRGRGIYTAGNHREAEPGRHATTGTVPGQGSAGPTSRARFSPTIPFCPPTSPVRRWSVRAFNAACFHLAPRQRSERTVDLYKYFYPLDQIRHWNRLYGPAGFQQFQCVIPHCHARDAIAALLEAISCSGQGSFLAVLKRCGDARSPGLMSFPMPGVSLALDFAQRPALDTELLPRLDAIVNEAGGRLYPAKDAHMTATHFRQAYPAWERLEALRDPALMSRFWQRVASQRNRDEAVRSPLSAY